MNSSGGLLIFMNGTGPSAPGNCGNCRKRPCMGENIFAQLIHTVRHCSLGQITGALYEVGGQYRRNM